MNTNLRRFARTYFAAALAAATGWAQPAAPAPVPPPPTAPDRSEAREPRTVRVYSGTARIAAADEPAAPREKAAFLGVEVQPAPTALSEQFGLARGVGLVVTGIVADSPAAAVLQQSDLLVRLDDQLLIEPRQLAVLVRSRRTGDEVELAFYRGGQERTTRVRLGEREVPRTAAWWGGDGSAPDFNFNWRGQLGDAEIPERVRQQVERAMENLRRADGQWRRVVERTVGGEPRDTVLVLPRSTFVFSDAAGSVEMRLDDDRRTLVVKDPAGQVTFEGDVSTEEARAALSPEVRERLRQVEALDRLEKRPPPTMELRERPLAPPAPPPPPSPPLPGRAPAGGRA